MLESLTPAQNFIFTILCTLAASSGFWTFMTKRSDKKDKRTKLLVGMAHDRIMSLGNRFILRGYITPDEYENLRIYLYDPYALNGGNGSAKYIMEKVDELPVHPNGSVPPEEMIF